ncbi:MAG: VapC toxin family PIN domain ribonuclease [Nitrosomonas sp.]|nr:VapC toxin family PIN domain ribonuclease [Nitrosomonas sp.]
MAVEQMQKLEEVLITTWPVVTETSYLLGKRLGVSSQLRFISVLETGYIEVFDLQTSHLIRIRQLIKQYEDLPMDLTDTPLVLLAEELGHGQILSTDTRDFKTYRWKNYHPFQNLLLPDV